MYCRLMHDERGYVRWEALQDEYERSGMGGAKFARLAGIKHPSGAGQSRWAEVILLAYDIGRWAAFLLRPAQDEFFACATRSFLGTPSGCA
jgi:hypothetical protein